MATALLAVAGCGGQTAAAPPTSTTPELPMGGRTVFPGHRVVAHYGTAGTAALGVLGQGTPEQAADAVDKASKEFATPDRPVQPAMEFIATVADGGPGKDGVYSHDVAPSEVRKYLDAARKHKQLFILDVQPGQRDFREAVKPWQSLLAQPDVGLALDAEWRMPPGQVPGKAIGHVDADEVNGVLDWVAELGKQQDLPQKVVVLHMFRSTMVTDLDRITNHPELAIVQHLDGFGGVKTKMDVYHDLARPQRFHMGFKLFYTQDHPLLTAKDVLAMTPQPEFVSYQ